MASDDHAPGFVPGRGYTQEDWDEVSDNPPITVQQFIASQPLVEANPSLVAAMKRGRGNPRSPTKDLVSLRLDKDVLATLRAGGSGWQSRANEMLRKGLGLDHPEPATTDNLVIAPPLPVAVEEALELLRLDPVEPSSRQERKRAG